MYNVHSRNIYKQLWQYNFSSAIKKGAHNLRMQ